MVRTGRANAASRLGKGWPERQADCREYRNFSIHSLRMEKQIFRIIGNDLKGKLSIIAYAAAIIFAFYFPVISYLIYIAIALTWIVPDSRLEKA